MFCCPHKSHCSSLQDQNPNHIHNVDKLKNREVSRTNNVLKIHSKAFPCSAFSQEVLFPTKRFVCVSSLKEEPGAQTPCAPAPSPKSLLLNWEEECKISPWTSPSNSSCVLPLRDLRVKTLKTIDFHWKTASGPSRAGGSHSAHGYLHPPQVFSPQDTKTCLNFCPMASEAKDITPFPFSNVWYMNSSNQKGARALSLTDLSLQAFLSFALETI